MTENSLFLRFGVAIACGILVGMQREFASETSGKGGPAGVRTFSLMALLGCSGAMISESFHSPLPLTVLLLVIGALLGVSHFVEAGKGKTGLTTKTACILTVLAGAICFSGYLTLAVAITVITTVILSLKLELHKFAHHLTHDDIIATLKFAIITAIVLPILPDRSFGPVPFNIFNPMKIWLFVVLISGISFVGYVLIKVVGSKKGIGLTGVLGGLASSTAVTISFARKSNEAPELSKSFAVAITVAWTVMYARVLVAVAALNIALVHDLWLPLSIAVLVGLAYCAYLINAEKREQNRQDIVFANPFELSLALKFGLLFVVILFISRAAQVYSGEIGIYVSSFFAGLADVDAIALSMAKLSRDGGGISSQLACRAIVLAAAANTLLKGSIVMLSGAPALKKAILPGFILILLTSIGVLFLV